MRSRRSCGGLPGRLDRSSRRSPGCPPGPDRSRDQGNGRPLAGDLVSSSFELDTIRTQLGYALLNEERNGLRLSVTIAANFSRYVVDLNRPPDGHNLYPGQDTPGLVPLQTFAGEDIYDLGEAPGPQEISQRVEQFWRPYHERLSSTLEELRSKHGVALLWEAHTIRSEVPRLFEGRLSDINLGTNGGTRVPRSSRRRSWRSPAS